MDTQVKNILGIVVIAALVVFTFSTLVYTRAYSKSVNPAATRSFSVSAEGEVLAAPDIAEFSFSVITQGGTDLSALQTSNTEKVNRAITFVKNQGIAEKDIQTSDYSANPRYQYFNCNGGQACPPPEIIGYEISQTVRVKVRDFAKVGPILSGVVANGANSVSGLVFRIEDPTMVQNKARKEAIAKAKDQAKEVADAGGFRLGKLLSIEEAVNGYPPVMPLAYGRGGADMAQAEKAVASIQPGSNQVTIQVVLHYEIK